MELLLAVVILSIIAALAVPLLEGDSRTRLQEAVRLLMADLAYAQSESIAHPDDPYGLKFDSANESYSVVHDATLPFDCASASIVTDPISRQNYTTAYGTGRGAQLWDVGIDSISLDGDDCIVFGALGETDQVAAGTITLSAGAALVTISIDPVSGETSIP